MYPIQNAITHPEHSLQGLEPDAVVLEHDAPALDVRRVLRHVEQAEDVEVRGHIQAGHSGIGLKNEEREETKNNKVFFL